MCLFQGRKLINEIFLSFSSTFILYYIQLLTSMDNFGFSQFFSHEPMSKDSNQPANSISMKSEERINNNYQMQICLLNFEDINSHILSDSTPQSSVKRESIEDEHHSFSEKWNLNLDSHYPCSNEKIRYFSELDNSYEQILSTRFDLDYTLTQVSREIQKKSSSVMSYMRKFKKSTNLLKKLTQLIARQKDDQSNEKKSRHLRKMIRQKKFNIKQFKKLVTNSNILSETEAFNSRKQLHMLIRQQLTKTICHGKTLDKRDSLVQSKVYNLRLRSQTLLLRQQFR